jgi:hypothetical protein
MKGFTNEGYQDDQKQKLQGEATLLALTSLEVFPSFPGVLIS